MALAKIPIPDRLELGPNATENWKTFKQRWVNYTKLTEIDGSSHDNKRKLLLLHCLGDEALRTYNSFNLADDATAETIIKELETFVIGETNIAYERFQFNKRIQSEHETFDQYYSELQRLMKSCDYCANCRDSILRDKIVIGVNDAELQKDLLKIRKLTLKNCIDMCRANEKATLQNKDIKPESINKIFQKNQFPSQSKPKCKFCGKSHEFRKELCPAYGKTCRKCQRPNHFAEKCLSKESAQKPYANYPSKANKKHGKPVNNIENEENTSESADEWIYKIQSSKFSDKEVKCTMLINNNPVKFQIDSGSSVNILPEQYVKSYSATKSTLNTWNNARYQPLGESRVVIKNPASNKKFNVNFIICHNNFTPILGLKASEQMKLISVNSDNFERVNSISSEFNELFNNELGTLSGEQSLKIKADATSMIMPNRKVPVSLKEPLLNELNRMLKLGVIAKVEEPTEWVSQSVLAPKKNGSVRLCLDPRDLNKVLLREHYTLPTIDDILHELKESTHFSKADLASGYWHIVLDEESSKLTTFQTCFGRYRYLRLPFGLSVSAEIFQKRLISIFSDLPGIICIADDIIIHGKSQEEHDKHLHNFLQRCKDKGVSLNKNKMKHNVPSLTFMGHKITKNGLEVDEEKVRAINEYPKPSNVSELRTFLGMVNFVAKFIPNTAKMLFPLNNLLQKDIPWNWYKNQEHAFLKIKEAICNSVKLAYYDPAKELILENDASEYGLGSTLMQDGKPIAFASRSLSDTERRYAQIEKEMLAITYGLSKFHHYAYGRQVSVTTDHKPLVSIVQKPLCKAPKRLQNMLLKNQNYNYTLIYKRGTEIPVADALSRAPVDPSRRNETVHNISYAPIKESRLQDIRIATETDDDMTQLKKTIATGWPDDKCKLSPPVAVFFSYKDELTIDNGVIFRGERIVIPKSLRSEMKRKVHAGHTGINSCLRRARNYIFWPGMSAEIRQFVEACDICASLQIKQQQEPLCLHDIPERPWQKVAMDIFTVQSRNYLVTTDYFSQFFEVDFLPDMLSATVIHKSKANFARHGIPELIISDNAGQFTSQEFKNFLQTWNMSHKTISPGNSKANGAAEAAVKIAKRMMKKCHLSKEDPYIALLNLRNTPQEHTYLSPVQKLMGRNTNTLLPTHPKLLKCPLSDTCQQNREEHRNNIATKTLKNKELLPLDVNDTVRVQPIQHGKEIWQPATVIKRATPRSYIVELPSGTQIRRDRHHLRIQKTLRKEPTDPPDATISVETAVPDCTAQHHSPARAHSEQSAQQNSGTPITSRSGRAINPPSRYSD